jgi:hypothetical protein
MNTEEEIVPQRHEHAAWNGAKVFTATVAQNREALGERVTLWMRQHPELEVMETCVTQSSDEAFHCLAITVFFRDSSV